MNTPNIHILLNIKEYGVVNLRNSGSNNDEKNMGITAINPLQKKKNK